MTYKISPARFVGIIDNALQVIDDNKPIAEGRWKTGNYTMRAKTTEEQFAAQVENANEVANDVFAQFMGESVVDNSREAVIKELLANGNAKRLNGLTVRNVVATTFDSDAGSHTLLTFVVKEFVVGDTRTDEVDAFGQPVIGLGKTHNVQSSSYAVAGVMKDTPKLAIFAKEMVDNPELANLLFAGGKLDVVMEFVPKDTDYVNPFATNPTPTRFERDKVIHHIISVSLGEVGEDVYKARLMRWYNRCGRLRSTTPIFHHLKYDVALVRHAAHAAHARHLA